MNTKIVPYAYPWKCKEMRKIKVGSTCNVSEHYNSIHITKCFKDKKYVLLFHLITFLTALIKHSVSLTGKKDKTQKAK